MQGVADKLVHPLLEVRRRSLQSLDFKVKHGLITQEDLLQERSILRNVLDLLQFSDNGDQMDAAALLLIQRIATCHPLAAKQLLQIGIEDALKALRPSKSQDVQQVIDATLQTIISAPITAASSVAAFPQQPTDSRASIGVARHTPQRPDSVAGQIRSTNSHLQGPPPLARPLELEFAGAAARVNSYGRSNTPLKTPHSQHDYASGVGAQSVGPYTGVNTSAVGLPAYPYSQPGTATSSLGPASTLNNTTADVLLRASMARSQVPRHDNPGTQVASFMSMAAAMVPAAADDWLLPPVLLPPQDEQYLLFELAARLKCMDDPAAVVLPALQDVLFGAASDLPAEALVSHLGIMEALMSLLLGSYEGCATLQPQAAMLLTRLVRGLKHSLQLASDPMLCSVTNQTPQTQTQGMNQSQPAAHSLPSQWRPGHVNAAAVAMNATAGFKPSKVAETGAADAYPAPKPHIPEHLRQGPGLQRYIDDHKLLNVSQLASAVAVHVAQLLNNPSLQATLLPLLEELWPFLILDSDAELPLRGNEIATVKAAALLQPLSAALLTTLSIAKFEAPILVRAHQDDGSQPLPLVVDVPSINLVLICTRLLAAMPPDTWTGDMVPPGLSDTMASILRDEFICKSLPAWCANTMTAVLAKLRPDVGRMLTIANDAESAVTNAQQLTAQLPHLLSGTIAPNAWLEVLGNSLLALDLAPDDTALLAGMLQGLAFVCSSASLASEDIQTKAEATVMSLLAHPLPQVKLACHSLLEDLLAQARGQPADPLALLVSRHGICQHLVVYGLADPQSRPYAAGLLLQLLHRADPDINKGLLQWAGWVAGYESDPQVAALATGLALLQRHTSQQQMQELGQISSTSSQHGSLDVLVAHCSSGLATPRMNEIAWDQTELALRQLFAKQAETRQAASLNLRNLLYQLQGYHIPSQEPHSSDPLKTVLDGGLRDAIIIPMGAALDTAPERLARRFRPQDVDNLMSILGNKALATELRKSAAEQLLGLVLEPGLRNHMTQQHHISVIIDTLSSTLRDGHHTTAEVLSQLDMLLPVAAANLLYALACFSHKARAWLCSPTGGQAALLAALPLLFHSLVTVRHAMGRLVAAVILGREADKWSDWGSTLTNPTATQLAQKGLSDGANLCLPRPFAGGYLLPCRVVWIEVTASSNSIMAAQAGLPDASDTTLKGKPKLQELVAEQRACVALLVEERRILAAADNRLQGCIQQLQTRAQAWRLSPAAGQACCHNINQLDLTQQMAQAMRMVGEAMSHSECSAALTTAASIAVTDQGLAALANSDWQKHMERLLINSPLTTQDCMLWLDLLPLVERMLSSGHLSGPKLLHLALCMQQSGVLFLSQPKANIFPPAIPIALAGSAALTATVDPTDREQSQGTEPRQQMVTIQTTHHVITTLLQLVHQARGSLPVGQAARTVHALGLVQLLTLMNQNYLNTKAACSYTCKTLMAALLEEVLAVIAAQAMNESTSDKVLTGTPGLENVLLETLVTVLKSASGTALKSARQKQDRAASPDRDKNDFEAQNAAEQTGFGNTQNTIDGGTYRQKGVLVSFLHSVHYLLQLLPTEAWSNAWQQESSVYWVVRLLRDRDVRIRAAALQLLAQLAAPNAHGTQRLLVNTWPDAAPRLIRLITDIHEPYAVRAAAMQVLTVVMSLPDSVYGDNGDINIALSANSRAAIVPLSREALLKQSHFWDQLPCWILDQSAPAAFITAAVNLLLQGLLIAVEAFVPHLKYPSLFSYLVNILSMDGWQQLARNSTAPMSAVISLNSCQARGMETNRQTMACTATMSCGDMMSMAAGLVISKPSPAAGLLEPPCRANNNERDATPNAASNVTMQGMIVAAPSASHPNDNSPTSIKAADAAGKILHMPSVGMQHTIEVLQCCTAVSKVVCLAVMEPELIDTAALGHTHTQLLAQAFAALVQLGQMTWQLNRLAAQEEVPARPLAVIHQAMRCCKELLVAASNLAHLLTPAQLVDAITQAEKLAPAADSAPLLVAVADLLAAKSITPQGTCLAAASLAATLMAHPGPAACVLYGPPAAGRGQSTALGSHYTEEYPSHVPGQAAGAAVCMALTAVCPPDLLDPEVASGNSSNAPKQLEGEALVYIVALRNLLVHSQSAKLAALQCGLHAALQTTCLTACNHLEAAQAKAAVMKKTSTAQGYPPVRSTRNSSGGGTLPPPAPATRTGASSSLRKRPANTSGSNTILQITSPAETDTIETCSVEGWSSPISSPSKARNISHSPLHKPSQPTARPMQSRGVSPSARHSIATSVQGQASGNVGSAALQSNCALSASPALEVRVTVAVSLLKHLAYKSKFAKQQLVQGGLFEVLRRLWRLGFLPETTTQQPKGSDGGFRSASLQGADSYFVASPALHEVLGLLTNMMPDCPAARAMFMRDGQPTLLQSVLALIFECKLEASTWGLCTTLLSHLAATPDGTSSLLRGGVSGAVPAAGLGLSSGEGFLGAAQKLVVDILEAGLPMKPKDIPRLTSILQIMVNMAAHSEGQKSILKSPGFARAAELLLQGCLNPDEGTGLMPQPLQPSVRQSAVTDSQKTYPQEVIQQALMLVRNLCFSTEAKAHLLVHPKLLPSLVAFVERVADAPQLAAVAASAIWALIYQGEKVKSALRRVPNSLQKLTGAKATADFQSARLTKLVQARGTKDTAGLPNKASVTAAEEALRWVNTASEQITQVLKLMESTGVSSQRPNSVQTGLAPVQQPDDVLQERDQVLA